MVWHLPKRTQLQRLPNLISSITRYTCLNIPKQPVLNGWEWWISHFLCKKMKSSNWNNHWKMDVEGTRCLCAANAKNKHFKGITKKGFMMSLVFVFFDLWTFVWKSDRKRIAKTSSTSIHNIQELLAKCSQACDIYDDALFEAVILTINPK